MEYVVGDIHGCLSELKSKLDEVGFDKSRDVLYCVGDLCDRGMENVQTVRFLHGLGSSFKSVFGNHDVWLYDYLLTGHPHRKWLDLGGEPTYQEFTGIDDGEKASYAEWLGDFSYCIKVGNSIIVHDLLDVKSLAERLKSANALKPDAIESADAVYSAASSVVLKNARESGFMVPDKFFDSGLFGGRVSRIIINICEMKQQRKLSKSERDAIRTADEYLFENFSGDFKYVMGHSVSLGKPLEYGNISLVDTGVYAEGGCLTLKRL